MIAVQGTASIVNNTSPGNTKQSENAMVVGLGSAFSNP